MSFLTGMVGERIKEGRIYHLMTDAPFLFDLNIPKKLANIVMLVEAKAEREFINNLKASDRKILSNI